MRSLLVFFFSMISALLLAQSAPRFSEHLQEKRSGQGIVVLIQDEEIARLLDNVPEPPKQVAPPSKPGTSKASPANRRPHVSKGAEDSSEVKYTGVRRRYKAQGFRIQVFSGTGNSAAKRQAKEMEKRVRSLFPELSVYCHFKSPRWICRVGDFPTREAAERYLQLIRQKRVSPEASIVADTVLLAE